MFDPEQLLGQMLTGALGNAFGGRGRGLLQGDVGTKAAVGMGLLGVAIAAYEHYGAPQADAAVPPPPPPMAVAPPPPPPAPAVVAVLPPPQADAVLLIRCMIAAAAADGSIDADERAAILARAQAGGVADATRAFLDNELATPPSLADLLAASRPELAAPMYAAALLALRVDSASEREWLDRLAAGLGLGDAQRAEIGRSLGAAA